MAAHPAIDAIRPHGSVATGELDSWSDLDVVLTVPRAKLRYVFPDTSWLAPLGRIYAMSSQQGANASVLRIVFENLERLDIRIIPAESETVYLPSDPGTPILLTPIQERTAVFLFEALLATAKIGRNDLLIGGHLVLNLERMVLELAMLLRDRALNTTVHRHGGLFNDVALNLTNGGFDANSLLTRIESTVQAFDSCARLLDPAFTQTWAPLQAFLARARPVGR